MMNVALRTLFHERGKFVAALLGVCFAATLVLAQSGLYFGFKGMSTTVISHLRGDVWVMAKGTQLFDSADRVSAGAAEAVAAHPCVRGVRSLIMSWATLRKPSGAVDNVQLIGFARDDLDVVPWSLADGLPADLHAPMRVAVDRWDLPRLELGDPAIGAPVEVNDVRAYVGAVTTGIRAFTVVPFVFAEATSARALNGMAEGQSTYLLADMNDAVCERDFVAWIGGSGDLQAVPQKEFERMTADYWMTRSGAGGALGFSALLGLLVGVIVVGQTLYSLVGGHLRELATWRTMGATSRELLSFVLWQAGFLAVAGTMLAIGLAVALREAATLGGLSLVVSTYTLLLGFGSTFTTCGLSALISGLRVLRLEPAEVFK
ncbi:ABC transporter permease [Pendulispora albinea]|uniref:ABC transporter permease n=1 Tax=Pendulispora albinea TaxID=2741071 RepID=A0ABZ2M1P7_9BACT